MTRQLREPPRLLRDAGADPDVQRVLRAGLDDGPSRRAAKAAPAAVMALLVARSAGAVGLGSAAAGTSAVSAGALGSGVAGATVGSAATALVVTKWVGIGVVVGASVSGALHVSLSHQHHVQAPAARAAAPGVGSAAGRQHASGAPVRMTEPTLPEIEPPSPVSKPDAEPSRGSRRGDLSRELRYLDAARSALSRSDPTAALAHLDELQQSPRRVLAPEATVLRVHALLALGQDQVARSIVERFARTAPQSPQLAVMRRLLDRRQKR